jgi:hypothetical protein
VRAAWATQEARVAYVAMADFVRSPARRGLTRPTAILNFPSSIFALTLGVLCAFAMITTPAHADLQIAWTARYDNGLPAKSHKPLGIVFDKDGNLIVAGTSAKPDADGDYVVLKFTPTGSLQWSRRFSSGNTANYRLDAFAVDSTGAIALTGTGGTVKYSSTGIRLWDAPYAGKAIAMDPTNVYVTGFSAVDFATVKINAAGSNVWLKTYDKAGLIDHADRIAVDAAGNVFVAGFEQWFQCYPTVGCYGEMAVVKYSPEGNQLWSTVAFKQSSGDGEVKGLIADALGNVVVTGNYTSGSESGYNTAKIASDGQKQWAKLFTGGPGVNAMAVDLNQYIYLTGLPYTLKLSSTGSEIWRVNYESEPLFQNATCIALDSAQNVYVAGGTYRGGATNDISVARHNGIDGSKSWIKRYNGRGNGNDEATGIAVDTNGNVYVTGYATTPEGGTEIVVLKYSEITNIQKKADGAMRLQFFGSPGQSYSFEGTTNFLNWLLLGSSIADSNGLFQFDDTNAPAFSFRFYRYAPPR